MPDYPRPIPEYVVNDLDTLRVLADPLRIQIIELVTHTPRTVKQVAADLDLPPTKLYYHIKLLEERDLIRVVDTRIVSGIVEKHYLAAALSYRVNKALFSPTSPAGRENLYVMLTGLFDDTKADVQASVERGVVDLASSADSQPLHQQLLMSRKTLHLTNDEADAFYQRLDALIREFSRDATSPQQRPYGLLLMLYPTARAPVVTDENP